MENTVPDNPQIPVQPLPVKRSFVTPKRMAIVGLLIVVLLLLFGLLRTIPSHNQTGNLQPTTVVKKPTPTVVDDETKNWNIYTNKDYGFTFKHPGLTSDEGICGQRPLDKTEIRILDMSDNTTQLESSSCYNYNYGLFVYVNREPSTIDQKITGLQSDLGLAPSSFKLDDFKIGNKTVKHMQVLTTQQGYWAQVYQEYYFYADPDTQLVYSVFVEYPDKKYASITRKIVSTLMFDPSLADITVQTPFYQYFPNEAYTRPDYVKRNYDTSVQHSGISQDFFSAIDNLPDKSLVNFRCSYDISEDPKDMSYHYTIYGTPDTMSTPKTFDFPLGSQMQHVLRKDPRKGFRGFQYCLTSDRKEYLVATFDGGPFEIAQLNNDKINVLAKDPSITGWYDSCSELLAITNDNNFYVLCGGGDTSTYTTINKIDTNTGIIKEIIQCVTPEEGEMSCTRP